MIPAGWVLVPVIPSERMLDEFSEVAWPDKREMGPIWREKRALEIQAYAAMLAVAPAPPVSDFHEVEVLKRQIKQLETLVYKKNKAISKLSKQLWEARRVTA